MSVTTQQPIVITPMRRRHLRGVVRVEQQTNHRPWSHGLFAGELRLSTSRTYVVALAGAVVVGFGGVMFTGAEAHITNVAVDPTHRRRGIGTGVLLVLMRACIERDVSDATLEVRVTNAGAQELYRRFGFAPGGIRRNYYSDIGEDALIMWANDLSDDAYGERLRSLEAGLATPLRIEGC